MYRWVKTTSSVRNPRLCLVLAVFGFIVLITYMSGAELPVFNYYDSAQNLVKIKDEPKTILLWTTFFSSRNWYLPANTLNESYFKSLNCPVTNCIMTTDSNYLESITQFDAVMFHTARKFAPVKEPPLNRSEDQLYIFAILETPPNTDHNLYKEKDFYNLTMTYRLDSDIVWPYAYIKDIETGDLVAPDLNPKWLHPPETFELNSTLEKMIESKNTTAAWFVSHCNTQSKREKLVKDLQKYVQIDVYGSCGPLRCPRFSTQCDDKLDWQYKFYLSFENSLCDDYVTEKLYTTYKRNVVPIVYGGARYYRFAPPHSYIDADNFKSVKELADYLKYLERNPEEYKKYFWWKSFYKVETNYLHYCKLCEYLNNPSTVRKRHYSYSNIHEWWYRYSCNSKPNYIQF